MVETPCGKCNRKLVADDDTRFKSRCRTCKRMALPERKRRATTAQRDYNLRTRYGVTLEQFYFLLDTQEYSCAICGIELIDEISYKGHNGKPVVDHCHDSGNVRGILCNGCNLIIGHAKDDIDRLKRAIVYLEERGATVDVRTDYEEAFEDAAEDR